MTIEKTIYDKRNTAKKIKFLTELQRRFEDAKSKGFEGDIDDFKENILRKRYKDILIKSRGGLTKGGPVKPIQNGPTTLTSGDWDLIINSTDFPYELFDDDWMKKSKVKTKPKKVAFKYGASSQHEEDLIGGHVDDWTNAINKGELDPSVDFMKYINMILGRDSVSRGGIVSIIW